MNEANSELTEKELRFCREYAADPNGTQAYLRAYGRHLSVKSARTEAARLLAKPCVKREVRAARKEYNNRVGLSAAKVLRGLSEIAFADMSDCFEEDEENGRLAKPLPWNDIPAATRRAMQGVKIKRKRLKGLGKGDDAVAFELEEIEYKFPDKNAAFEKLCKHLGLTKGDAAEVIQELIKVIDLTPEKKD